MEEADLTKNGYNYVHELKSLSITKIATKFPTNLRTDKIDLKILGAL